MEPGSLLPCPQDSLLGLSYWIQSTNSCFILSSPVIVKLSVLILNELFTFRSPKNVIVCVHVDAESVQTPKCYVHTLYLRPKLCADF